MLKDSLPELFAPCSGEPFQPVDTEFGADPDVGRSVPSMCECGARGRCVEKWIALSQSFERGGELCEIPIMYGGRGIRGNVWDAQHWHPF